MSKSGIHELESFPLLDWHDVAPHLSPQIRSALEHVLEIQDGSVLSREQSLALANAAGDDLVGLLVTRGQHSYLCGESEYKFHQHLFCGLQILRIQPRAPGTRHLFLELGASRGKGRSGVASRRH